MPVYHSGSLSKTDRPDYIYPLRPQTADLTKPLAPRNLMVTSPYDVGKLDIRWDNPKILPQNSGLDILGVNIYRATDSGYGPYVKINDTPIGVLFYRDETKEELVINEDATATLRPANNPDGRWLIYSRYKPIVMPGSNGQTSDRAQDVLVKIDNGDGSFIEVPAFQLSGRPGEIQLIDKPVYNYDVNQIIPPRLPWPPTGRVRITYRYLKHQVLTVLNQRIYYKATTVAVDPTDPSKTIETPLDEVSARSSFDIEMIDYIWREAIKRNYWLLEQGGERVKLFTRKWMGVKCETYENSYGQNHQDCPTCFPEGQFVTLSDGSKKDIKNININDTILTSQGISRTVSRTFSREYHNDLINIKVLGKDSIRCTKDHPFLVIKKEQFRCKRWGTDRNKCVPMTKNICFKGYHTNATDCIYRPQVSWVYAADIEEGDYLVTPRIKDEFEFLSNDEMFLFGFYTAEGCISLNGNKSSLNRFRIGFGKTEMEILKFVRDTFERQYHLLLNFCESKDHYELWCCNKFIADRFLKYCGKGAHTKILSSEILKSTKESIGWFLSGYLIGDGHVSKNARHLGSINFSTVSHSLISQLELLFSKMGCPTTTHYIYHDDPRPHKSGWIYVSSIPAVTTHCIPLVGGKRIFREIKKIQHKIIPLERFICYPVKELKLEKFSGLVYNIEVDGGDHTYLVQNCVVHNCLGTLIVGGWEGPFDIIIAPPETEKSVELADMGLHIRYDWQTWTGDFPLLNERDVIVRQNNERYIVGPVNPQGSRGAIYQQHFTISYIDQGDVRYSIGISGGENSVPESWNAFREPKPTDASPTIPVKPEVSADKIIKGRTVVFENITF